MMRRAALALALSGCFSSATFDECTSSSQCGEGFVCAAGTCRAEVTARDASLPDASADDGAKHDPTLDASMPDAAEPDAGEDLLVTGDVAEEDRSIEATGRRVILRDVTVRGSLLNVRAREIIIEGRLLADGAGHPGGGGGGGGAAGHATAALLPGEGGAAPKMGVRGAANPGLQGGSGGAGNEGSGTAGGIGGAGGTRLRRDAEPGGLGHFADPAFDACDFEVLLRLGSGGGGGGGGAGSDGLECRSGGGGGGGGAGGPGGGAFNLIAEERIIVRGELSARGLGVLPAQRPAGAGGEGCAGGIADMCEEGCDPARHGRGGDGGAARFSGQDGGAGGAATEGDPGGGGGTGGGGGGGMVRLVALHIDLERGARVDVSGSAGESNGGFVMVRGATNGELAIEGAAFRCIDP